jgi:hypothetical protein
MPNLVWLALLAMLALALLPTVSRAMAASQDDVPAWLEFCTAQGMKRVVLDVGAAAETSPQLAPGHLDRCSFCGLSAQGLDLPRAPAALLDPPSMANSLPRPFLQGARSQFPWFTAQPRAPPLTA